MLSKKCIRHFNFCAEMSHFWYMAMEFSSCFFHSDSLFIVCFLISFSGHGAIVGILKVGRKRLFVYDRHGHQWEMNPVCVLDFYVHESRQRMGCGRRLFDFMLKVSAYSSAVTFFSHFATAFTADHYCVFWGGRVLLFLEAQSQKRQAWDWKRNAAKS